MVEADSVVHQFPEEDNIGHIHNSADVKDILHLHTIEARNLQRSVPFDLVTPSVIRL